VDRAVYHFIDETKILDSMVFKINFNEFMKIEVLHFVESHSSREIPAAFKIALMSFTSTSSP